MVGVEQYEGDVLLMSMRVTLLPEAIFLHLEAPKIAYLERQTKGGIDQIPVAFPAKRIVSSIRRT